MISDSDLMKKINMFFSLLLVAFCAQAGKKSSSSSSSATDVNPWAGHRLLSGLAIQSAQGRQSSSSVHNDKKEKIAVSTQARKRKAAETESALNPIQQAYEDGCQDTRLQFIVPVQEIGTQTMVLVKEKAIQTTVPVRDVAIQTDEVQTPPAVVDVSEQALQNAFNQGLEQNQYRAFEEGWNQGTVFGSNQVQLQLQPIIDNVQQAHASMYKEKLFLENKHADLQRQHNNLAALYNNVQQQKQQVGSSENSDLLNKLKRSEDLASKLIQENQSLRENHGKAISNLWIDKANAMYESYRVTPTQKETERYNNGYQNGLTVGLHQGSKKIHTIGLRQTYKINSSVDNNVEQGQTQQTRSRANSW